MATMGVMLGLPGSIAWLAVAKYYFVR
jgi:hypothetical protein